jgi:hypothetical protein
MDEVAVALAEGAFEDFFTPTMRSSLLDGFVQSGAHEGTVWLIDASERFLVPRFNNGPKAASFVGRFRQSLQSGMVSMVVATQQPICENRAHLNAVYDPRLDQELGLVTSAMIAVPFYFAHQLRGVISAVQLRRASSDEPTPPGFSPHDLHQLQRTADVLERLIEHELLTQSLGLGAPAC